MELPWTPKLDYENTWTYGHINPVYIDLFNAERNILPYKPMHHGTIHNIKQFNTKLNLPLNFVERMSAVYDK